MKMKLYVQIALIATTILLVAAEDFYELLDVSRQATQREIRRAFKKLAIKMHPDKNPDDKEAHKNFLRINRAYEVLKDEDLRKKYDMYGEDGLKEDGPTGRGYQSWNFYQQDFGIYDDDPEIITLSKSDFEQSVEGTNDVWFINYYSAHCGHCHDLAPTWREVARELEGVIRIGAVNCQDDWMLCRQQGIRSYPSLIMYQSKEKYYGSKTRDDLVAHALKHVKSEVIDLRNGNFKSYMSDEDLSTKPWVITFCGDGGDCLQRQTATKLAAMLHELVNVAMVDCHENEKICGKKLGIQHGTHFFQPNEVEKKKGLEMSSLDAKEIAFVVLEQLPDVTELDGASLQKTLDDLRTSQTSPWLLHFVEGSRHDLELRKLPAILSSMKVGRVDCRFSRDLCNNLHIIKFPTFAVFKAGGGYEVHHGRLTASDVAAFAKDSAVTPLRVLGPQDFPMPVISSGQPWFVDFYAPWCPPCMRLLPEFRKAAKQNKDVNFGTVDCTVHTRLCQEYGIRSYPTTIFYNQSTPHQFHGHHSSGALLEFLQDTLNPPVVVLDPDSFNAELTNKETDVLWLVDFYAPWCGPCQQLAPEWRRLAKMFNSMPKVRVGQLDCEAHHSLCQGQGVRSYPSIRLYPTGVRGTNTFQVFNGWFRDAQSIRAWAFEFLPSSTVNLNLQKFQKEVLPSKEPWIIDFFAPWCGHCQMFSPEFERVAQTMEGVVKAGKVDCDQNEALCRQVSVRQYPSVRLYPGSTNTQQSVYGEDIDSQDADYIIRLLKSRFKPNTKNKVTKDEL